MPAFNKNQDIASISAVKQVNSSKKIFSTLLLITILTSIGVFGYFSFNTVQSAGQIFLEENNSSSCDNWWCSFSNDFKNTTKFFAPDTALKGQDTGRTNFLLLGMDSSAGLSDSIIIASYFHTEKKIVTINIPRDTLISGKIYNNGVAQTAYFKINELYKNAVDGKQNGAKTMTDFISKEYGINIDYWVTTNFEAVEKVVDALEGVEINVDNAFRDCEFPNRDYSGLVACQTFAVGNQTMDGNTALTYARSRHGVSTDPSSSVNEGTDFARSRRQSIVVQAILQKIKTQNLIQNISNLNNLLRILGSNVKTNINLAELKSFFNITKGIDLKNDFLRVNYSVDNELTCETTDVNYGYHINYCDGVVAGTKAISNDRTLVQQKFQNLLDIAIVEKAKDLKIGVFGNGAKSVSKIKSTLANSEIANLTIDNTVKEIPVTATADQIYIYSRDEQIKENIQSILAKKGVITIIQTEPPLAYFGNGEDEIYQAIIWVE